MVPCAKGLLFDQVDQYLKTKINNKPYCMKYEGPQDLTAPRQETILTPCTGQETDRRFKYVFLPAGAELAKRGVFAANLVWATRILSTGMKSFYSIW